MKIFFTLTPAFNPNDGGVQRTTYKLGKYFTEQGLSVSYYSTALDGHITPEFGQLFNAPFDGGQGNPKNIADLRSKIAEIKPDFVINQMPYEKNLRNGLYEAKQQFGFVLLGCLRNSLFSFKSNAREIGLSTIPVFFHPFIKTNIGLKILQWQHWIKHRGYLKKIIDQHDRFILLAPPNQDELKHFVGNYKSEKIHSIPNSIPYVEDCHLEKEKTILHVGRLNKGQKRSDLLLDFWQHAHVHLPDWFFVIVGDGTYFSTLQSQIKSRNLPRVVLKGHKKPESYYKRAPIFMMPSAYEGFPNTILEAQSHGCVPLAFNSYAALDWIVNDGKDALLSQPYNTEEMAEHAIMLAKNNELLTQMMNLALENSRRFTIEKVGKQWINLFYSFK